VQIHEHRHNLKEDLLEKSKYTQQPYEEGQRVSRDEAKILEIESNSRYRKYKDFAHMVCLTNAVSQPNLEMSPIGFPLSAIRSASNREARYDLTLVPCSKLCSTDSARGRWVF
jgi:hypothetical protein